MSLRAERYLALREINEIRLLHLQPCPTNDHDLIQCTLVHTKLSQMPSYQALSYMWGPEENPKEIEVDGQLREVRENLWQALQHLRWKDRVRVLWIDALCINQNDVEERNHQVTQMSRIYGQACRVCVWLGPGDVMVERDIRYRQLHPRYNEIERNIPWGIEQLCSSPYWERLWIVQEVSLASEVEIYFGSTVLTLEAFSYMHERYNDSRARSKWVVKRSRPNLARVNAAKVIKRRTESLKAVDHHHPTSPIYTLVRQFRHAKCADARDRAYGLRSLSDMCCRKAIPVDYSNPTHALCNKILEHHYRHHHSEFERGRFFSEEQRFPLRCCSEIQEALMMVPRALHLLDESPWPHTYRSSGVLVPLSVKDPLVVESFISFDVPSSGHISVSDVISNLEYSNPQSETERLKLSWAPDKWHPYTFSGMDLSTATISHALNYIRESINCESEIKRTTRSNSHSREWSYGETLGKSIPSHGSYWKMNNLMQAIAAVSIRFGIRKTMQLFIEVSGSRTILGMASFQTKEGDIAFSILERWPGVSKRLNPVVVVREAQGNTTLVGRAVILYDTHAFKPTITSTLGVGKVHIHPPDLQWLSHGLHVPSSIREKTNDIIYKDGLFYG